MKTCLLFLLGTLPAFALPPTQAVEPPPSRALQQARRVASMENENDLPSRAVWLGQRAAKNTKLAYQSQPSKKRSKKSASTEPKL